MSAGIPMRAVITNPEGHEKLIEELKTQGVAVEVTRPRRNGHKDGQRRIVAISITPDTFILEEKLESILRLEGRSRSDWYREQVSNYVSQRLHF